jgi:phospholipase C
MLLNVGIGVRGMGDLRRIDRCRAAWLDVVCARMRHFCAAAGLGLAAGAAGCNATLDMNPSPSVPSSVVTQVPGSPIQHIVIIMQENRTFDNLFSGFPGADTVESGPERGRIIPLHPVSLGDGRDPDHSHKQWWKAWDYGAMDNFEDTATSPARLPYSYVPEPDVEPYWTMAREYTLGDRMFQSNTGPSFAAHQYMIAGQSADVAENPSGGWGCDASAGSSAAVVGPSGTELPGVYPCFDYKTAADLLDGKGVTWRYYAPGEDDGFFILSAFQAVRHIRFGKDWKQNVISPQGRVLVDIKHGELAQVTWIVPDWSHSDHPGSGSKEGPDWVASIVNAIGESPYWNSTAIFITWDDWGGWYDHVQPPVIDAMGPGFRVPLLVVSPYAKRGYISHHFHEASGFISFIERNFDLGTLGARDAGSDAYIDCFDYGQAPAPFHKISTRVTPENLLREAPTGPADDDDY